MKLSLSQIKEAVHGIAYLTQENEGIRFCRFTEHQQEIYKQTCEDFYKKTYASAGIRLDFLTDSKTLKIAAKFTKASSRVFAYIDIVSDGKELEHIGYSNGDSGNCEGNIELGEGEHIVKVYFPWSAQAVLQTLELEDGASFIPVKKKRKMIIFGDSITQGYDAKYPSHSYASILADTMDADARNKGIGGDIFFPQLLDEKENLEPDLITVAYGTNDWSKAKTVEEFMGNMTLFYTRLSQLYPKAKICAICPIWRKDMDKERPAGKFEDLENKIRNATKELSNVYVISGMDFVPHDEKLFSDGYLHPNDEGFSYYAKNLTKRILEIIE